jgi:hypothetical protein
MVGVAESAMWLVLCVPVGAVWFGAIRKHLGGAGIRNSGVDASNRPIARRTLFPSNRADGDNQSIFGWISERRMKAAMAMVDTNSRWLSRTSLSTMESIPLSSLAILSFVQRTGTRLRA